ncbi:TLC domain-containing protein 2 [Antechinus flavipes]|uniref:TLC domain-containing protein 2 n=1 Tax=Antechinus flavipes TaxID=38775 RepID=UPI0022357637|nr:TLC domain-containing protein 2 [Antechinus flavipes]
MAPAGFTVAAVSFALFRGLHRGLKLVPTPPLADPQDRWMWRNICASLVHSLLAGAGALLWMSQYSHLVADFARSCPPRTAALVSLSIGYFLADGVDLLWNQPLGRSWHLLCHHALAVGCLGVAVLPGSCLSISVVPLLLEVNSVCLHLRTLLLLAGLRSSLLCRLVSWATLATLLVFRLLPLGWTSLQLLRHHPRFPLPFSVLWGVGLLAITIMSIKLLTDLLGSGPWAPASPTEKEARSTWERGREDYARPPHREDAASKRQD